MRIGRRTALGSAGLVACVAATAATIAPAQARPADPAAAAAAAAVTATSPATAIGVTGTRVTGTRVTGTPGQTLRGTITADLVRGAAANGVVAPAAGVPSTSPAVSRTYIPSGGGWTCEPQYACAAVPYGSGAYFFKFLHYDGYSLSNWTGTGFAVNNQTDRAAFRYDDVNGVQKGCVAAGVLRNGIDWGPIWRIRLTGAAC